MSAFGTAAVVVSAIAKLADARIGEPDRVLFDSRWFYLGEHRGRDLGAEREAQSLPEVTLHRTKRPLLSAAKCAGCKQARFPRHHAASSAVSSGLAGYTDLLHFIT